MHKCCDPRRLRLLLRDMLTPDMILYFAAAFLVTAIGGLLIRKYVAYYTIKSAKEEAQELIEEIKSEIELKEIEQKARAEEISLELWTKVESAHLKMEERAEELQELIDERKKKADQNLQIEKAKADERAAIVQESEKDLQKEVARTSSLKEDLRNMLKNYSTVISERIQTSEKDIIASLVRDLITEAEQRSHRFIEESEEDTKIHAEQKAKRLLGINIDRFARPYCPERGISGVYFESEQARKLFNDPAGANIRAVQEHCGCDIYLPEQSDLLGVAGYDPVRREHTRRTLEKVLKEKRNINPELIKRVAEQEKRNLLKQIKTDGDAFARELKLDNMHPEIRQMMGSLRFRYSFTQNQYFHCAEVGWLAGLLAAEVGADLKKSRRAGALHDLGKAMDHQLDGGHAVIGAEFIKARGELAEVVHAVKAHHFDEQPSTDEAFLVIAADAISGARPGARRSTMETYTQKVTEIQDIAKSFDGVTDCFVLNGGREARVHVNSKRVDDQTAMKLSSQIAKRIEEECSYPGQIKVVVVRETQTQEHTAHVGR